MSKTNLFFVVIAVALCSGVGYTAEKAAPQTAVSPTSATPNADDSKVVTKVNSISITEKEVQQEIDRLSRSRGPLMGTPGAGQKDQFFKEALKSLVQIALLKSVIKEKNITLDDADIDKRLAEIKKQFPNEEAYKTALSKQGITEEKIRESLLKNKETLLIQKALDQNVKEPEAVKDEEIKKFYDDNKAKYFTQGEQVKASHILLEASKEMKAEEKAKVKERLAGYKADIEAKKVTFEEAAKKYSADPGSKDKGGDLDYFTREQMVKPFADAAFSTPVGKMSDIVESDFGFHLIKVSDKKPAGDVPLDTVKDKIKGFLANQKKQEAYKQYLEMLEKTAKIENLITEEQWNNSHKPAAAPQQEIQIDPSQLK